MSFRIIPILNKKKTHSKDCLHEQYWLEKHNYKPPFKMCFLFKIRVLWKTTCQVFIFIDFNSLNINIMYIVKDILNLQILLLPVQLWPRFSQPHRYWTNNDWCILLQFGLPQANLVLIAYASSDGSGEPAHPRSLARTSAARSYKQWVKRNLQTENQIPGPSELLGMHSLSLSWRNARRHKFAWRGPYVESGRKAGKQQD